jgi:hypothetical protein
MCACTRFHTEAHLIASHGAPLDQTSAWERHMHSQRTSARPASERNANDLRLAVRVHLLDLAWCGCDAPRGLVRVEIAQWIDRSAGLVHLVAMRLVPAASGVGVVVRWIGGLGGGGGGGRSDTCCEYMEQAGCAWGVQKSTPKLYCMTFHLPCSPALHAFVSTCETVHFATHHAPTHPHTCTHEQTLAAKQDQPTSWIDIPTACSEAAPNHSPCNLSPWAMASLSSLPLL